MTAKKYRYMLFYSTLFLLFLFLMQSERTMNAARASLMLCARSLIPALLAPLVFSGILSALCSSIRLPGEGLFARIFHLPACGLSPFLLGALCGFPIGAKVTAELYEANAYSKEEASRIAALAANTGPAFAVAGVGVAFFKSVIFGWLLYIIQLLSAIILGFFDARKHPFSYISKKNVSNTSHFFLSDILYRSSISLLTITATVVFFGTLCALPSVILPRHATAILAAILEVGNGTYYSSELPRLIGFPLAAFSISFSGISVLIQNAAHLLPQKIPFAPLVYRKLVQGMLSMLIAFLILPLLE